MRELALIEYIRKRFPGKRKEIVTGIGDDALTFRNGFVISTDSFIEMVHFDRSYFSMYQIGYHCLAASLSDLAAMAAEPISALVSLQLSTAVSEKDVRQIYDGFGKLARTYSFDIAGGDIVASPHFGLNVTVVGRARTPLLRSGARPGQGLFVTNFLGLAETGRCVLQGNLPAGEYGESIRKHRQPEPRIKEALVLKRYMQACIDTSDGLSSDAFHLAHESGVRIVIDVEHIPVHSEVGKFCNHVEKDPTPFILDAGEDFELLFTAQHLPKFSGLKYFRIGSVKKGKGLYLSERGKERPISPGGYEHRY